MAIVHLGYDNEVYTPVSGEIWVVAEDGTGLVYPAENTGGGGGGATSLNGLNDVVITSPADNEVLAYDISSGDWINQTAAEAGLATSGHNHDADYADINHLHDATDITTGTFANARISEASVTQHQAALIITESQISDLSHTAVGTAPPPTPTGDAFVSSTPYQGTSDDAARADHKHFIEPSNTSFREGVQDIVGGMVTGNTETDIDVTYDDTNGKLNFVVTGAGSSTLAGLSDVTITTPADNEVLAYDSTSSEWINQTPAEAGLSAVGHTHVSTDVTDFAEAVSDQVGTMVTGNTETGIVVTFEDSDNTLDFVVDFEPVESLPSPAPGGSNDLTGTTQNPNQSQHYGTTFKPARSDHRHNIIIAAFDTVNPVTLTPDIAAAPGVQTKAARRDHVHNVPAATAVGLSNASTNTEGNSTSFARANHTHAITGFALTSHTHAAGDITSGTFADARISASSVQQHVTKTYIDGLNVDADTLDGLDSTAFATSGHSHTAPALNDVTDVVITTPADDEVLAYDSTSGNWINQTAAEAGLATSGHSHTVDHGATTGLGDDDHTQYLNTARHAAIDAADHGSGAAADGHVLTADGAGGAAWEAPTGGGGGHPHVNTVEISDGSTVQWEIDLEVDGTLSFNFVG